MNKRRITLNLDADIVEALEAAGGKSMSDTANRALREVVESMAHRRALLDFLEESYREHGAPSPEDYAAADRVLEDPFGDQWSAA